MVDCCAAKCGRVWGRPTVAGSARIIRSQARRTAAEMPRICQSARPSDRSAVVTALMMPGSPLA